MKTLEERLARIRVHEDSLRRKVPRQMPRRRVRMLTLTSESAVSLLDRLLTDAGFVTRSGSRSYDLKTDANTSEVRAVVRSMEEAYGLAPVPAQRIKATPP